MLFLLLFNISTYCAINVRSTLRKHRGFHRHSHDHAPPAHAIVREVEGSGLGVYRPTWGCLQAHTPGGLQAHTQWGLQAHMWGVSRPTPSGVSRPTPSRVSRPTHGGSPVPHPGGTPDPPMATAAGGAHPTGILSCLGKVLPKGQENERIWIERGAHPEPHLLGATTGFVGIGRIGSDIKETNKPGCLLIFVRPLIPVFLTSTGVLLSK